MKVWQRVFTVQNVNKMPELSTPRRMFSQENSPANRRELSSTAGEIMSDMERVLEEVNVNTRDRRESIDMSDVSRSLARFL